MAKAWSTMEITMMAILRRNIGGWSSTSRRHCCKCILTRTHCRRHRRKAILCTLQLLRPSSPKRVHFPTLRHRCCSVSIRISSSSRRLNLLADCCSREAEEARPTLPPWTAPRPVVELLSTAPGLLHRALSLTPAFLNLSATPSTSSMRSTSSQKMKDSRLPTPSANGLCTKATSKIISTSLNTANLLSSNWQSPE